jgi:RNA polymerase sigma-70 factor, ECF subfamily
VLILREVLGFSAAEAAEALETTVASVNSSLQRARAAVDERVPEASQQETLRALGDDEVRELVERYAEAWERGDVDGLVSMLAEDAVIAMPPMATWFAGRDGVEVFLREFAFAQRWSGERFEAGDRRVRLLPIRASGQLAFATYRWDDGAFRPQAIQVLTLRGRKIVDITGFVEPDAFAAFGLPDELD